MNIKSHPNKLLIDHYTGILSNVNIDDLILIVTMFHDIGKININFQNRINKKFNEGYSHHSYLSGYFLINGFINSIENIKKRFTFINDDNLEVILILLTNIIVGHHGKLRNIDNLFKSTSEVENMRNFLKLNNFTYEVDLFFKENHNILNCDFTFDYDINNIDYYLHYGQINNIDDWKNNSLDLYIKTISTFSELIYGDRKDASDNKEKLRTSFEKMKYGISLDNNLNWLFNKFVNDTPLNTVRNEIREYSVKSLKHYLESTDERLFTLTAPTGSGKTLMMLQLAVEIIKKRNYEHDIIYALPFLSIIDQTSNIINDTLRINLLEYTSSSDTSMELNKLLETGDNKALIDYAFSENSFEHPFIITTFNQVFETLINNQNTKLIKLTNFKKRIFLIDEYQAISHTQHYFNMNLLKKFCEMYDSYAIISTATMPNFDVNFNELKNQNLKIMFKENKKPIELLDYSFFKRDVFNRYRINFIGELDLNGLVNNINKSNDNTLVVVNTINTSQELYNSISNSKNFDNIYLINSNITPKDRVKILSKIKESLKNKDEKTIVISTQVIEAGVDISFPVLFRDAAPPSSIIQANGRGNRNGEFGIIDSYLFLFLNENGRYDCDMVYQNLIGNKIKNDIINKIDAIEERDFHKQCVKYFKDLTNYTTHGDINENQNIVEDVLNGNFDNIGKYRLINDDESYIIYVGADALWKEYIQIINIMKYSNNFDQKIINNIKLKKIRGDVLKNCISIRRKKFKEIEVEGEDVFGIYKLKNKNNYNNDLGLII